MLEAGLESIVQPICAAVTFRLSQSPECVGLVPIDYDKKATTLRDCATCGGTAELQANGAVEADRCVTSGSCERSWASMHPDQYLDDTGQPSATALPCAGNSCKAIVRVSEQGEMLSEPRVIGRCAVDLAAETYWAEGDRLLNNMPLCAPHSSQLESFDGQIS